MTELLTSVVKPHTASHVLAQLDKVCESANPSDDFQPSYGPFGAFRVSKGNSTTALEEGGRVLQTVVPSRSPSPDFEHYLAQLDVMQSPQISVTFNPFFGNYNPLSLSALQDWPILNRETPPAEDIFDSFIVPQQNEIEVHPITPQDYRTLSREYQGNLNLVSIQPTPSPLFITKAITSAPPETGFLLNHYVTTVIPSLTPFSHSKTPWHVLFVPLSKGCLADLTLGEHVDHATLCVFYGILAISAFSIGAISQSCVWLNRGKEFKQRARHHVITTLDTAYNLPKPAKYKSILMALILMVQVAMFSETQKTEYYLLETERFIRLKGLQRRKSRKVRLLHHCYFYTRIFHESTIICGYDTQQRRDVREAVEKSGMVMYSRDGLSFRLKGWLNLEEEMKVAKGQEVGENDLHLGRPGNFPTTLYPEIYGVTESWLYLLSQVIRLGNEKDDLENVGAQASLSLGDFLKQAGMIERCIHQLERPSETDLTVYGMESYDHQIPEKIFDVMQAALLVYFYRRIYNINSSMLQPKVLKIRNSLIRYAAENRRMSGCIGLVWPAFIAACEAEDLETQKSFSNWFKQSAARYGLSYFTNTLQIVEKVWEEKKSATAMNVTWLDHMRKNILPHNTAGVAVLVS